MQTDRLHSNDVRLADSCPIPDLSGAPTVPDTPSIPSHPMTAPQLWASLESATTKGQAIDAMRGFLSSQGWFAGCPKSVREKLEKMV